ncbi:unnamed protein product [Ectocarpus sp. 12 AP-2014]
MKVELTATGARKEKTSNLREASSFGGTTPPICRACMWSCWPATTCYRWENALFVSEGDARKNTSRWWRGPLRCVPIAAGKWKKNSSKWIDWQVRMDFVLRVQL